MLPSETVIWQPEFTDKTLSRKTGAVHMAALTIDGLKQALTYIQDNGKSIAYYEVGPRKGLMVTDQLSEDDAYHLRVVQSLEPRLVARLAEQYTMLSLDGQELLHMLSDDRYLDSLRLQLQQTDGYSDPADVQIFKLLRKRLEGAVAVTSWPDVIKMLVERSASEKLVLPDVDVLLPTPPADDLFIPEPESVAAEIIQKSKSGKKEKIGA